MEDEGADLQINSSKIDTKSIIAIQAVIRGALVRKWMREIKLSFTEVVSHLEKNPSIGVEWYRDSLCLPKVSKKQRNKPNKVNASEDGPKESLHTTSLNKPKPFLQPVLLTNKTEGANHQPRHHEIQQTYLNSVETQTSFIEISHQPPDNDNGEELIAGNFVKQSNTSGLDIDDSNDVGKYKDERKLGRETYMAEQHLMVEVAESDGTDTARSQSVQSEIESISAGRLSQSIDTNLNLLDIDEHTDGFEEDKRSGESGRSSYRSTCSNKDKSSRIVGNEIAKHTEEKIELVDNGESGRISHRSTGSSKHVTDITEVEDFQAIDSDRSRHSARSLNSNKSDLSNKSAHKTQQESGRSAKYNIDNDTDGMYTYKDPLSDRSIKSQGSHKYCGSEAYRTVDRQERPNSARSQSSHGSSRSRVSHRSAERSAERDHSPVSDRSETSLKSQRSDRTEKSVRSVKSDRSRKSDGSRVSESSQKSRKSRPAHSPRSPREPVLMSPRPSSVSPVPTARREESHVKTQAKLQQSSNENSTMLTNVTSIWDSFNSCRDSHEFEMPASLPEDPNSLRDLRKNISMELLWVQQAIDSRKNYLKLKNKM